MAEEKKEPIKLKTLFNPTNEDLHFKYDSAPYVVKAGKQGQFIEHIAFMGAKVLADKHIMTNNPDEHKVLMKVYLDNNTPESIAKSLGVNLDKIRKEAITKEQAKARVVNLEAQVLDQRKRMIKMEAILEKLTPVANEIASKTKKTIGRPKGSLNKKTIPSQEEK